MKKFILFVVLITFSSCVHSPQEQQLLYLEEAESSKESELFKYSESIEPMLESAEAEIFEDSESIECSEFIEPMLESTEAPELLPEESISLLPRYIPAPVEISDFGRTVAENFLREYPNLYSLGTEANDGTFRDFNTSEILDERPLVLLRQISENGHNEYVWLDRDDVPFVSGASIAFSFSLYDFDFSGIPDIIISMGYELFTCAVGHELYRFIDGEYRFIESVNWEEFFYANDGRLIALNSEEMGYYHHISFSENGLIREDITDVNPSSLNDSDRRNYHRQWAEHHWRSGFQENPSIMNTNIPLTPILPLNELRDEIIMSLRASEN